MCSVPCYLMSALHHKKMSLTNPRVSAQFREHKQKTTRSSPTNQSQPSNFYVSYVSILMGINPNANTFTSITISHPAPLCNLECYLPTNPYLSTSLAPSRFCLTQSHLHTLPLLHLCCEPHDHKAREHHPQFPIFEVW